MTTQQAISFIVGSLGSKKTIGHEEIAHIEAKLKELQERGVVIGNYVDYIQANRNHASLKIGTAYQKWLDLHDIFMAKVIKTMISGDRLKAIETAEKISRKVETVSYEVLNSISSGALTYLSFRDPTTKEPYFKEDELEPLEEIGTLLRCVHLQRSSSGTDRLEEKLIKNQIDKLRKNAKRSLCPSLPQSAPSSVAMLSKKVSM